MKLNSGKKGENKRRRNGLQNDIAPREQILKTSFHYDR